MHRESYGGMQVSVLGPVEIRRDGRGHELGERQQRLLAALVVAAGSVVSVDRLVDIVWAGDPPDSAAGTLRTYVTRLRQALDAGRDDVVVFRQPGYGLDLRPEELDSSLFDDELGRAMAHLRVADSAAAVGLLEAALGRWRGDAFALFADEEWVRPEAVRLEERRLEAREALVEARLGVGSVEHAVAEASGLVEAAPLRERPRVLLMRTLYVAGRQAEALRVADDYRRFLVAETGLDPSADVVELEGRIARGAPAVAGSAQVLRGYELHERVGEGAFAVVHRATQPGLQRDVAIKIIRGVLADQPDFIRRFEVEAQTVARVEHPNVVPLFDFWREPGAAYLVMRLLRGGSVEQLLRARGPYSREQTVRLLDEVGGALETAHRFGVVHRDVRPANLLLDDDGVTYLADFGIALPTATAGALPIVSPAYAAPEILRGEPASPAADVLSLGVTVFELLTGRLPFADSADRAEVIRRQLAEPLPPVRATRTDLPAGVDEVLARATAKAVGDRHGSIAALVEDLRVALTGAAMQASGRNQLASLRPVENPYVGLHLFDEQDADRYFGREALVVELVDAIEQHPLVAVVGASGSGKSSAVRAGLLQAVRRGAVPGSHEWFVTTMLPGADPIDSLETALLRVAINPPATLRAQLAQPGGLLRAIRRVLPDERAKILLVVDQFEEVFTQVDDPDERDRFLTELAVAVTAPDSPVRVVATLRADHYDAPLRHPAVAQLVTDGTVTVRPMTADELERAITLPARNVGVDVESSLVVDLVAAVTARPAALPLLQFSLTELFDRRAADVMLLDTHRDLGGLTGATAARADRIIALGDGGDEAEVRRIFGRLVTLGDGIEDTRRRVLRSELGTDERTAWLVDEFVKARLLTSDRDPATREPTVEVAHEALLRDWPRLRAWLDDDRADLRTLRQITTYTNGWNATGREHSELARGSRLDAAIDIADRHPDWLNDTETEWIDASTRTADAEMAREAAAIEHDRQQNRRLKVLLTTAVSLLLVAVLAAAAALVLRNRAAGSERDAAAARDDALANEAEARANAEMASDAEADAEINAQEALEAQAAAEANAQRADLAREDAEIERLVALSAAQLDEAPDRAILLALEANRRRDDVATRTALHRAFATEPRRVGTFPARFSDQSRTLLSDDGTTGMAATFDDGVEWFDPMTGTTLGTGQIDDIVLDGMALSGDGAVAAVGSADSTITFVRSDDGAVISSAQFERRAILTVLDQAGRRAAFLVENVIYAFDVETGTILSEYVVDESGGSGPTSLALSGDGALLFANWVDSEFRNFGLDIIDVATGELRERRREPEEFGPALTRAVGPDGLVATGYADGIVRLVSGDTAPAALVGHTDEVTEIAVGRGIIVSASSDDTVRAWSPDGDTLGPPLDVAGGVDTMGVRGDGTVLIGYDSGAWDAVDLAGGPVVRNRWPVELSTVYPDQSFYETPVDGFTANEYRSLEANELLATIDFSDSWDGVLGGPGFVSRSGEWVLSYKETDFAAGEPDIAFSEITGDRQYVHTMADVFERVTGAPIGSSDSVAIRVEDGGERFYISAIRPADGVPIAAWMDMESGEPVDGPVDIPVVGPALLLANGGIAVGGLQDVVILAADLDDAQVVVEGTSGQIPLHQDPISGRVLLAGDGTVNLLDPATGTLTSMEDAVGEVFAGSFSPDGEIVAVATYSDGVQLLDVSTVRRIGVPIDPDGIGLRMDVGGLSWSKDGTGVWTAPSGGPILFDANPDGWRDLACSIVHRELTEEEWRTFVSPDTEPVASCPDLAQG